MKNKILITVVLDGNVCLEREYAITNIADKGEKPLLDIVGSNGSKTLSDFVYEAEDVQKEFKVEKDDFSNGVNVEQGI